jgi:hypothetical protein
MTLGYSVVGVFSARADAVFVAVLRKWRTALELKFQGTKAG